MFGKAVLPDINDYYRSSASIDLNRLPENVEALRSIQQLTLTEGRLVTVDLMLSKGKKPWRLFG